MTAHPRSPSDGHIAEDRLVDLALGDAPSGPEAAHLAGARRAADSLASLVRTIDVTREAPGVELVAPAEHLWAGHRGRSSARERGRRRRRRLAPCDRDDLHPTRAPRPWSPRRRAARRPALAWLAAACAAGVAARDAGTVVAERLGEDARAGATVATAELDTLDTSQWLGSADRRRAGGRGQPRRDRATSTRPTATSRCG